MHFLCTWLTSILVKWSSATPADAKAATKAPFTGASSSSALPLRLYRGLAGYSHQLQTSALLEGRSTVEIRLLPHRHGACAAALS